MKNRPAKKQKTHSSNDGEKVLAINSVSTAHIVVRIRSEDGRTISAHRKVIEQHGRVMFAKIGKGLGNSFLEQLNGQTGKGLPTYLFLATHEGWNKPFGMYQCELVHVHTQLNADMEAFVPSYMQQSIQNVSTWFEIRTIARLSREESNRIYVLTSGREITSAIRGTTAVFRVGVKGDAAMKLASDQLSNLAIKKNTSLDPTNFDEDGFEDNDKDYVESWLGLRDN